MTEANEANRAKFVTDAVGPIDKEMAGGTVKHGNYGRTRLPEDEDRRAEYVKNDGGAAARKDVLPEAMDRQKAYPLIVGGSA